MGELHLLETHDMWCRCHWKVSKSRPCGAHGSQLQLSLLAGVCAQVCSSTHLRNSCSSLHVSRHCTHLPDQALTSLCPPKLMTSPLLHRCWSLGGRGRLCLAPPSDSFLPLGFIFRWGLYGSLYIVFYTCSLLHPQPLHHFLSGEEELSYSQQGPQWYEYCHSWKTQCLQVWGTSL